MKKNLIVSIIFVFGLLFTSVYAGDEKKAISTTFDKEVKAFLDKDYDTWAGYWVHEPYVSQTIVRAGSLNYTKSWDSLSAAVKESIKSGDSDNLKIEKGNYDIHVTGDMALVFAKEKVTTNYMGKERIFDQVSTNVLKKVDGNWKFISMDIINSSSFENNDFNTEMQINMTGYKLLTTNQVDKAIQVFELNTKLFPEAFNTWDSLAEAYMVKGDREKATKYYQKSMMLNSKNDNAQKMIDKMANKE